MVTNPVRRDRWLNAAFFGEFGVGKTHLAGTACDVTAMQDVLFIDCESGDLTLETRPTLDVLPIRDYKKIQKVYEWLKLHAVLRDHPAWADESKHTTLIEKLREHQNRIINPETDPRNGELRRYKTIVLDSFTELQKLNMYMLMGVNIHTARLDEEMEKAQWDEWGQTTNMIRLLIRTLRDMPYHVILVCSERMVEDKNKRASIVLNLPKTLAAEIPGFLDLVGYLAMKTDAQGAKQRILFLQPGSGFQAKCRFPNSPSWLVNPTMTDIMKMVKSGG